MVTFRVTRYVRRLSVAGLFALAVVGPNASSAQDVKGKGQGKLPDFIPAGYDDYQNMLDQLGIKKVRRGRDVCLLYEDTSSSGARDWMERNFPTGKCYCRNSS